MWGLRGYTFHGYVFPDDMSYVNIFHEIMLFILSEFCVDYNVDNGSGWCCTLGIKHDFPFINVR